MDEEDFSSDSSDEDYIPTENPGLSEEEDSGDDEDFAVAEDAVGDTNRKGKTKKSAKNASKNQKIIVPRKRKGGIRLEGDAAEAISDDEAKEQEASPENEVSSNQLADQVKREQEQKQEMEEKKKADSLWADFMKDVGGSRPKTKTETITGSDKLVQAAPSSGSDAPTSSGARSKPPDASKAKPEHVVVVKEFKFAGETVEVSTTVDANSKEAKQKMSEATYSATSGVAVSSLTSPTPIGVKRPAVGGLSSVLSKIDKRPKMSTLVKSKLDWDSFKSAEGIGDDLKIHNRGKDGYLERQAFLERTDHRQFEIEKSLRLGTKQK
jgi:hypothetical protein